MGYDTSIRLLGPRADVNIEYPDRVIGDERWAGWGTTTRQASETDNWLHFAIPEPPRRAALLQSSWP